MLRLARASGLAAKRVDSRSRATRAKRGEERLENQSFTSVHQPHVPELFDSGVTTVVVVVVTEESDVAGAVSTVERETEAGEVSDPRVPSVFTDN